MGLLGKTGRKGKRPNFTCFFTQLFTGIGVNGTVLEPPPKAKRRADRADITIKIWGAKQCMTTGQIMK